MRLCAVAAVFVLFYLVCMPISVAYVLLQSGGNGVRQDSKEYKAKYGFLYMRFESHCYFWHLIVMAQQLSINIALEFGGGLLPLVKFFLILLPIFSYTLGVFALRPFVSSEHDFIECSTQGLLLLAGLGGLLRTLDLDDDTSSDLGSGVVYVTLILAAVLIIGSLIRDMAYFFGSKQVLHNLNKGETKLPLLGPFDKGLNGIMLFHFAEQAGSEELALYAKLRASVSSAKILLCRKGFWAGVQSLEKTTKRQSKDMPHPPRHETESTFETERVTSAEFNQTVRFITSSGALQILRVLSKLCDEVGYIKISNWLVFNATSFERMQLCDLVLSMLTAQPKFARTPGNTVNAQHVNEARPGRYFRARVYLCIYCRCLYVGAGASICYPCPCLLTCLYMFLYTSPYTCLLTCLCI